MDSIYTLINTTTFNGVEIYIWTYDGDIKKDTIAIKHWHVTLKILINKSCWIYLNCCNDQRNNYFLILTT